MGWSGDGQTGGGVVGLDELVGGAAAVPEAVVAVAGVLGGGLAGEAG